MDSTDLEWTVLTWNLQGSKRTDLTRVSTAIERDDPDVVVLQEVRRPQAKELAQRLSMTHTWAEKHHPLRPLFPSRAEGAAILTPHELGSPGHERVSSTAWKRSYRRRIVQWATVSRSDASGYRVYNAHLSPHDLRTARLHEATRIAELAVQHGASPPTVVAGDFNDHDDPEIIGILPGIEAVPPPPTNPAAAPTQALDHVLVPPDTSDVSVSVPAGGREWAALSDHLPVTVRFTMSWVRGDFVA